MTTDPAAIAAKLTPAQRRAVMNGSNNARIQAVLRRYGLLEARSVYLVLSPLGWAVRAVLEARGDG